MSTPSPPASCTPNAAAIAKGIGSGALNIIGLVGLVQSTDNTALQQAQQNMTAVKDKWKGILAQENANINKEKAALVSAQIEDLQDMENLIIEAVSQKVQTNTLLIGMLCALVLFLILFDLF